MRHAVLTGMSAFLVLLCSSCEQDVDSVVDVRLSTPLITSANLKPAVINTDSVLVGPDRKSTDTLKLAITAQATLSGFPIPTTPSSVSFALWSEDRSRMYSAGVLRDDGSPPDLTRNDGVYAGSISFQIIRSLVGVFHAEITAIAESGLTSPAHRLPLTIVRLNQPPRLSDLIAPDSVTLGSQNRFLLLEVRASDPDGLSDIRRVVFNSFRPDGSPSSGNPFAMHDDGSESVVIQPDIRSGDKIKGDGIFSLTIVLPPTSAAGTYRFEFEATDRSDASSNKIIHFLRVRS